MAIWALGYATKSGLLALSNEGQKIKVKSTAVGNMFAPDADDLADKFLSVLKPDDTVITPSGPNMSYPAACLQKCSSVWWIHSGTLAKEMNGTKQDLPKLLLKLFEERRDIFYPYLPEDAGITELRLLVQDWLSLERQCVRDSNAHTQHLRREREYFRYFPQKKETWIQRFGNLLKTLFTHQLKKFGMKVEKSELSKVGERAQAISGTLFNSFVEGTEKEVGKARKQLVAARLEAFGVDELLVATEKEVKKVLDTLPQNKLFDGLISEGSTKVRAEILALIRNPLLYANVWALRSYAGIGAFINGQAVQKRRGEADKGNRTFKKALCFDFGDKGWVKDTVHFFDQLYYAYKAYQYFLYWDLLCLTSDVFKLLGKKAEEVDEVGGYAPDADENLEEEELPRGAQDLKGVLRRLQEIARDDSLIQGGVPMIARNRQAQAEIEVLLENPDPKRLWNLFSRNGFNLQMKPSRVELRTKRFIGRVLVDSVYYRWLQSLGAPLPLAADKPYQLQFKAVTGLDVATEYDHTIVLRYYQMRVEEWRRIRGSLPAEMEFKLCIPRAREAFLTKLSMADLQIVYGSLSNQDKKKYLPVFPESFRESLDVSELVHVADAGTEEVEEASA